MNGGVTHSTERDHIKQFLGDASGLSDGDAAFAVHPKRTEDVQSLLREASRKSIPMTLSGGNTGLAGGAIPYGGGVLATDRLDRLGAVDTDKREITSGAGVILRDLQDHVESLGFLYPPDPTERLARVGGTVATNASGARTFQYGATRAWVKGLVVVLATGERVTLTRGEQIASDGRLSLRSDEGTIYELALPAYTPPATSKNSAGYYLADDLDAVDLFVGSEGTLGVVTEVTCSLVRLPREILSGLIFFDDEMRMLEFVRTVRNRSRSSEDRLQARAIEYIDNASLAVVAGQYPELPADRAHGGAIWIEQESHDEEVIEMWDEAIREHTDLAAFSIFGLDDRRHRHLRHLRHAVPSAAHHILAERGVRKFGTDMAVPEKSLEVIYRFYRDTLQESGMESMTWGHIGNAHLHVNFLPASPAFEDEARVLYSRCVDKVLELGGTVSAEHGIGKMKREYLRRQLPEEVYRGMKAIRATLDPAGILGRGTLFDVEEGE